MLGATSRLPDDTERLDELPMLQTLNHTSHIQDRVRARYQELEQATEQTAHTSGTVQELVDIITASKDKKSKEKGLWP